ncbi:MAG: efflux RND transporter periplasmic adaptor subunit [Opitutus sp.]|nr:efflux RND transporter periplasmic adaptor subunit [Opitutus sp.]
MTNDARALSSHWPRAVAIALLALVAGLTGCSQKAATAGGAGGGKGGRGGGGPAPVIVGQVHRKVVPILIDAIGAVEPIRSAVIRSQITGSLMKIDIKEGQDVTKGDLLFEVDPRPFQNTLASTQADREKIHVQLETARAQVARYRTLISDSMVSKEQFQQIQDNERALTAQSLSSDAAVANAKLQLEYCSIRAPISGRTGNMSVHEGDLIRANDLGAMVTINQLSPIYVTFGVPQQYLAILTRYRADAMLAVNVVPPGLDTTPEQGELTFMDNTVDASTGTLKLKATFANAQHRLWPAQFTTVAITLAAPEVLVIASSAVQTSQTGQHVFVVKPDKTAELRPVTIERTLDADAVVTKGLAEGEVVVTDGQLRVISGKPVEVKQSDPTAAPGAPTERGRGKGKGKGKKQEP